MPWPYGQGFFYVSDSERVAHEKTSIEAHHLLLAMAKTLRTGQPAAERRSGNALWPPPHPAALRLHGLHRPFGRFRPRAKLSLTSSLHRWRAIGIAMALPW